MYGQNLNPLDAQPIQTAIRPRFSQAAMVRAIERATAEKLIPYRNADGTWSVKDYTVTPFGPRPQDVFCNCVAGQANICCKHWAATTYARKHGLLPIRPVRPALTIVKAFEGAEKVG